MNLLLDTHGFLWSLFTTDKLSKAVVREIKSPNNDVAVSISKRIVNLGLKLFGEN